MNPFEKAKLKRQEMERQEQLEKEKKKSTQYVRDYEEIAWMGLTKEPKVFRVLGVPYEVREKPTDPKLVLWSKIIHDNKKSFVNIYWPQNENGKVDEEFILARLHKKVKESKWIDYKEGDIIDPNRPRSTEKGYYVNLYENTASYKRIDLNKKEDSNQFGHFYPKTRILFNVIDRMDNWCKENKHSKILTSNYSPFEINDAVTKERKVIWFNDVGMPNEFYKLITTNVLEFRNTWDLDLIAHKEEKKYILRDGMEDKVSPSVKSLIDINPLKEEEMEYTLYNLDKLFKPTGYYKLFNSLENLFKQVDLDLNTKFYDELKHLYEEEKVQREKERLESEKTVHSVSATKSDSTHVESVSTETEKPTRRSVSTPVTTLTVEDKLKATPHWNTLSDSDKLEMIKYCSNVEGEKFYYKEGTSLIPCACDKKINYPDSVWSCTLCSKNFE